MKTKMLLLAVVLCATAFAGVLTDNANVFGPKAADAFGTALPSNRRCNSFRIPDR